MLRARIIPCLLIHNSGLYKTVQFDAPKYVGDPLNAVRIFNEKEVDELIVLDIDATSAFKQPDYRVIANLARECRMPLCYGGGIKNPDQVEKIISLGVEKVAISSAAFSDPNLITESARRVGNQSIVVVMDIKKTGLLKKKYELFTHNGKNATKISPVEFAVQAENLGAGEILLNSIDLDGTMKGFDFDIVDQIRESINIPMTIMGGAGSYTDISRVIQRYGTIGVGVGSLFVFKGKYRAVLIQYPNELEKDHILFNVNSR